MMKILILATFLLSTSANAEFKNTKWGMNLYDLRMVYQSGHSRKSNDGAVEYIAPLAFKNYPDSVVNFILINDKLSAVIVALGNKYSSAQCQEILNNLIIQYTAEFSLPDYQDENVHAWNDKSGGSTMLTSITKKSGCVPWISFFNKPFYKDGKFCDPLKNNTTCD
jgi:hypothetical protein